MFQHTATRRWLHIGFPLKSQHRLVSTHSHPKVAASNTRTVFGDIKFQHTATRRWLHPIRQSYYQLPQSFNTQPPEGGCNKIIKELRLEKWFQHTATRRWLLVLRDDGTLKRLFQHTATRRWLQPHFTITEWALIVSTHSHPKVAAYTRLVFISQAYVSTHSHPKVAAI